MRLDYEYCDIRYVDSQGALYRINRMFKYSTKKIFIIVGHGDIDGTNIEGINFEDYKNSNDLYCIWLYACNCGKRLAKDLTIKGFNVLAFITEIIISDQTIPIELESILKYVKKIDNLSFSDFYKYIRDAFYQESIKQIQKNDILQAAIYNHTRLALRKYCRE